MLNELKFFLKENTIFAIFCDEGSEESYFSISNKARIPDVLATESYQFTWTFSSCALNHKGPRFISSKKHK